MNRRNVLRGALGFATVLAGCTAPDSGAGETPADRSPTADESTADESTASPETVDEAVEARVKDCEREYIERVLISDENESVTDRSGPIVETTEARADGAYVELETQVGTVRSVDGEPDEHADYVVTAAYLVTDDAVYRTKGFDPDGPPHDGTTVDC